MVALSWTGTSVLLVLVSSGTSQNCPQDFSCGLSSAQREEKLQLPRGACCTSGHCWSSLFQGPAAGSCSTSCLPGPFLSRVFSVSQPTACTAARGYSMSGAADYFCLCWTSWSSSACLRSSESTCPPAPYLLLPQSDLQVINKDVEHHWLHCEPWRLHLWILLSVGLHIGYHNLLSPTVQTVFKSPYHPVYNSPI